MRWRFVTDVDYMMVDTMGYASTFHVVPFPAGVNIGAYVRYPTISTEMIHRVESCVALHNNSASVSSTFLTQGKFLQVSVFSIRGREYDTNADRYYRIFMFFYAFLLRTASFLTVNSSWTKTRIDSILYHDNGLLNLLAYLSPLVFLRSFLAIVKAAKPV